ncbi:hypothetical protein BDP27DRAFT_1316831 [Rhodocollybia butyracea]|uniref:Uncharacterized protein n=1 Tax=Rhodocollybia butyracea TaxID=206335 RepID=A0A9P5Q459_9AGAR|nr:hypothetical protein BDP27DRAFT_1316831 [Rhodocollybia butyracea]
MSWTALLLTLNSLAQSGRQYRCSPGNFHQCQCRDVILQMKLAGIILFNLVYTIIHSHLESTICTNPAQLRLQHVPRNSETEFRYPNYPAGRTMLGEEVYDTNLNQGVYRLKKLTDEEAIRDSLDCGFHAGCQEE